MKVAVVIWNDRHAEPEPYVFLDSLKEVNWAHKQVHENRREDANPEYLEETLYEPNNSPDLLYYGTYSCEGDGLWVVECEAVEGDEP